MFLFFLTIKTQAHVCPRYSHKISLWQPCSPYQHTRVAATDALREGDNSAQKVLFATRSGVVLARTEILDQYILRSASSERHHLLDRAYSFRATKMPACYETKIQIQSPGYSHVLIRATLCQGLNAQSDPDRAITKVEATEYRLEGTPVSTE